MRRFLLHVLPSGFHRTRHEGLLVNAQRKDNLDKAEEFLLPDPHQDTTAQACDTQTLLKTVAPTFVCPLCGTGMSIIETLLRDSRLHAPSEIRAPP